MDDNKKTPQTQPQVSPAPISVPPKFKEPFDFAQGKQKEQEPIVGGIKVAESNKVAKEEGDEYWENYAREIELEKEIEELGGIEKVESGEVKVPGNVAKEMGIKPTIEIQTPLADATGFSIRGVAFSDDQITLGLKKPTSSGVRWLIEWFIYQLLKAHFHIKRIKGKFFRSTIPV